MLAEPGREFHVLDLAGMEGGAERSARPAPASGDLGPVLDAQAKGEIRRRLEDLREREASAERHNDFAAAERARGEIEALARELSRAVGLGGRDRKTEAVAERARAAVTKALRAAIRSIADPEPGIGDLLSRTVRTRTFCSYVPLAEASVVWRVEHAPPGGGGA